MRVRVGGAEASEHRGLWGQTWVLNLSSVPRLCVDLGTSPISPQFHISKIGAITCTSEGCGKDRIGHK